MNSEGLILSRDEVNRLNEKEASDFIELLSKDFDDVVLMENKDRRAWYDVMKNKRRHFPIPR